MYYDIIEKLRKEIEGFKDAAGFEKVGIVIEASDGTAKISGLENNRHFWRGVIDGDGCMSVSVRGNHHRLMLSLTGSHPLLEQFRAFVRSVISDCNATVRPSRSVYCYTIGCRQARLMVRALYEGCKIALDRKLAIAERVMAHGF